MSEARTPARYSLVEGAFRQAFEWRHVWALVVTVGLPLECLHLRGYDGFTLMKGHLAEGLFLTFGSALLTCGMWVAMTPGAFTEGRVPVEGPRHRWRVRWVTVALAAFFTITLANASLWYALKKLHDDPGHSGGWLLPWQFLTHWTICTLAGVSLVFQTWNTRALPKRTSFTEVAKRERAVLAERRARLDFASRTGDRTFGLALSGGGIRSATTSLGVLEHLATRNLPGTTLEALRAFDYISSVSGGGWAAGAITAGFAGGKRPRVFIGEIVDRFRRASDYVIPGGVGLTRATLRPIVLITVGMAMNVAALIPFVIFAVLILSNMSEPGGWLMQLLQTARQAPGIDLLWMTGERGSLLRQMHALHVVTLTLYLASVAGAAGLGLIFLSMVTAPATRLSRPLRLIGQHSAEIGLLLVLLLGCLLLFIAGSPVLTIVIIAGLATAIMVRLLPRLDRSQRMKLIGALFTSQAILLDMESDAIVPALTRAWVDTLHPLILWPSMRTAAAESVYLTRLLFAELALIASFFIGFFVSRNDIGLHGFWTDRIRRAFLPPRPDLGRELVDGPLAALRGRAAAADAVSSPSKAEPFPVARANNVKAHESGAPIHIVNATVNLPGSEDDKLRNRGTARFELSPHFIGCDATGWAQTNYYGDSMTLASTLAISAAAVNSQAGRLVSRELGVALAAVNLSLGVWVRNPRLAQMADDDSWIDARFRRWGHFWVAYQFYELVGRNNEADPLLFVSDGGHHDNLGLSSLLARECQYIVCIDAGADPTYQCEDLAKVLRMAEIDGSWRFQFEIEGASHGFRSACAALHAGRGPLRIQAKRAGSPALQILYCKAALSPGAPIAVESYATHHPNFPHESTADQFFDEAQFEAYLQLGRHIGQQVVTFLAEVTSAGEATTGRSARLADQAESTDQVIDVGT